MTAPTYFAVEYAINPWMDTSTPVDTAVAVGQWETPAPDLPRLGHTVELVEPVAGLPDMVYAANGGLIVDGNGDRRAVQIPAARRRDRSPTPSG